MAILYLKNTLGKKNYEKRLEDAHKQGQLILYSLIFETQMDSVQAKIKDQIYIVYGGLIKCNIDRFEGPNVSQEVNQSISHLKENTVEKLNHMHLVLQEVSNVKFLTPDFEYLINDLNNPQQSVEVKTKQLEIVRILVDLVEEQN